MRNHGCGQCRLSRCELNKSEPLLDPCRGVVYHHGGVTQTWLFAHRSRGDFAKRNACSLTPPLVWSRHVDGVVICCTAKERCLVKSSVREGFLRSGTVYVLLLDGLRKRLLRWIRFPAARLGSRKRGGKRWCRRSWWRATNLGSRLCALQRCHPSFTASRFAPKQRPPTI